MWLTAPALVFSTVEFISTPRLEGSIIPLTPAHTQERIIAPTLCESSTPSRTTTFVSSPLCFSINHQAQCILPVKSVQLHPDDVLRAQFD